MEEGNTEFWRRRFLGEGLNENHGKPMEVNDIETPEVSNDVDAVDDVDAIDDVAKEAEDDEAEDEEEEVEQSETQVGDQTKDKEVAAKPLQMIGVQLLKDSDQSSSSRKSRRRASRVAAEVSNLYNLWGIICLKSINLVYIHWSNVK